MKKNVFVLGLTDFQAGELKTVRGSENYDFHALLGYQELVVEQEIEFTSLLERARGRLREFEGSVDAIVSHWDFPTSVMGPLLAAEFEIPGPSLESVLKCEHKYWSRLEQRASIPECVPKFASFDPFDDDALSKIDIDYPFWVKPVKAHSSNLGFEIRGAEDFEHAIEEIRADIELVGDAFNEVLGMVDLPPELREADGNTCLAEQFVAGQQAAPEGSMFRGEFNVHGLFDMHKDRNGTSFERLDYPADSIPAGVQRRMIELSERYLRHIGFDNGCFNVEFMWDADKDQLWLIEVNTRISQSHSDLFSKVDGVSNHEVAIDIALGVRPSMPHREGAFSVASQCMVFHDEDAVVTRAPTAEDAARLEELIPGTKMTVQAQAGDRLAELPNQDSYRYVVAILYIGAQNRDELAERHQTALDALRFEFEPVADRPS